MADHNERWALNHLIEMCRDEELALRYAADHVRNPTVKTLLVELASQRARFAADLLPHAQRLGGASAADSTTRGALHRGWVAVKVALNGAGDDSMTCCPPRLVTWSNGSVRRSAWRTTGCTASCHTDASGRVERDRVAGRRKRARTARRTDDRRGAPRTEVRRRQDVDCHPPYDLPAPTTPTPEVGRFRRCIRLAGIRGLNSATSTRSTKASRCA
jgi:hypothetical protein